MVNGVCSVMTRKIDELEGSLSESVFVKGKNRLMVKVEDGVKNLATFETDVYKK